MPEMPINLLKGDKVSSKVDYRDSLPVNMSAVLKPLHGASGYMYQEPGLTLHATGPDTARGALWNERFEHHYMVSGERLIVVLPDGNITDLGAIAGSDTVSLPYSFNSQGVLANGRFYLVDQLGGIGEVLDVDLGDPIDGVWVDGYYFFTDGEYIYHTDINDEAAIDPLKFATAEFMPDKSLGVAKTSDNKVVVFGRYTIEYFVNVATTNFSFQRVATRAIKAGIVGTHCKCEMNGQFFILGGRKEEGVGIHAVGVGSLQKVSSREIDKIIGEYTEAELSTSVLESRSEDDLNLLIVHLPNETLMFNLKVAQAAGVDQAWNILKTDVLGSNTWRGKHGVMSPELGKWVYGDKRNGNIGILDETVATHYGDVAEWILDTPFLGLESMSIDALEIEVVPGFTVTNDATLAVSLTYNGVVYTKEVFVPYGGQYEYDKRFIINRLGYVRNWFSLRLRGASRSRMAFSRAKVRYG